MKIRLEKSLFLITFRSGYISRVTYIQLLFLWKIIRGIWRIESWRIDPFIVLNRSVKDVSSDISKPIIVDVSGCSFKPEASACHTVPGHPT